MFNRLRIYLFLIMGIIGFSAFVGFSYAIVVPQTVADALETAIRGAETPEEVRSRIANYYSSTTVNRLFLFVTPSLIAGVLAALALCELVNHRAGPADDLTKRHGVSNSA